MSVGAEKKKSRFKLTSIDEQMRELVERTDHRTLATWAIDCAERVLHYFEERRQGDHRPREALRTLRDWIDTGVFRMSVIRGASLASHAAAREVGEDDAARSAARAAGQAVATAHVPAHSLSAAIYAQQAVHRAHGASEADDAVARERDWQIRHLIKLRGESTPE